MSEGMSGAQNRMNQEEFWDEQRKIYKKAYVTIALLVINIIMYILCTTDYAYLIYDKGALMLTDFDSGWGKFRTFTSMFLHADVNHLTSNMFMLLLLGGVIENYTGHIYYLFMYILSGLFGNFFSLGYEQFFGIDRISVGASGAIMGNVGFLALWLISGGKNKRNIVDMKFRLIVFGLYIIESCFIQPGANTQAHLGGFLMGAILGVVNIIVLKNNKNMEGLA